MESLVGMKNLVFCSDYNALTLFRILQKKVFRMKGAWQSVKQVILYGSWSNFPYYKPPPPSRGLTLSASLRRTEQLCGFEPCEPIF
jgi:hypothetical protein